MFTATNNDEETQKVQVKGWQSKRNASSPWPKAHGEQGVGKSHVHEARLVRKWGHPCGTSARGRPKEPHGGKKR